MLLVVVRRIFAPVLVCALSFCIANAQVPSAALPGAALRGVLGVNKFDLGSQYLGIASSGDGSAPYLAVTPAMGLKAIADAGDKGMGFVRVMAAGYGPTMPSQVNLPSHNELLLWQQNPAAYWSRLDKMYNDLAAHNVKIIPSFIWNPFEFPAITGETLATMITDPASRSQTLLRQYIAEYIGRYKNRRSILFYELTNELNYEADIDIRTLCLQAFPAANCISYANFTTAQMNGFAAGMVSYIKSLDPSHQVGSGYSLVRPAAYHLMAQPGFAPAGPDWTQDTREQFRTMEVLLHEPFDLVSIHIYPGTLLWNNPAGTEYLTLDAAAAAAQSVGKRLYVGEFGDNSDSPFMRSMLQRFVTDHVAYASVWVWEFYQATPWQSTNVTYAPGSSLEPGFTDALNSILARAAGSSTWSDDGRPRVVLTSPLPCATVSGSIELYAVASALRPIAKVEFSVDGNVVGTATAAPYHVPYAVAARGFHRIQATAFSGNQEATASEPVVFQSYTGHCTVP
jgi:Bacterial Ig domain